MSQIGRQPTRSGTGVCRHRHDAAWLSEIGAAGGRLALALTHEASSLAGVCNVVATRAADAVMHVSADTSCPTLPGMKGCGGEMSSAAAVTINTYTGSSGLLIYKRLVCRYTGDWCCTATQETGVQLHRRLVHRYTGDWRTDTQKTGLRIYRTLVFGYMRLVCTCRCTGEPTYTPASLLCLYPPTHEH